jgi:hypothetical protein
VTSFDHHRGNSHDLVENVIPDQNLEPDAPSRRSFVMEPILVAAYTQMLKTRPSGCSVDRILEDPELRGEYLGLVRASAIEKPERDILHTLNNLRKQRKLPRRGD